MRHKILRRLADLALTVGAVIGACCLVVSLASVIFGVQPLIFRSGSMAPAIPAGSLALAREVDAANVRTGDVVSVPYRDTRVTHRVVGVDPAAGGAVELRLRGDANQSADPTAYRLQHVDRVLFSVPAVGSVIVWLSRPPGVFVLAGYAAILLALIFRRGSSGTPRARHAGEFSDASTTGTDGRDDTRPTHARRVRAGLGVAVLGSTAALVATPTWAAFTDPVTVSGTTVATATIPAPTLNCGALGVLSVTFNWTAVPNATSYTLFYGTGFSDQVTVTGTTYTVATAINNGRARVVANRNFGSTTWSSVPSNTRTYTVAVVSLCS